MGFLKASYLPGGALNRGGGVRSSRIHGLGEIAARVPVRLDRHSDCPGRAPCADGSTGVFAGHDQIGHFPQFAAGETTIRERADTRDRLGLATIVLVLYDRSRPRVLTTRADRKPGRRRSPTAGGPDTDRDGLSTSAEVRRYHTDPRERRHRPRRPHRPRRGPPLPHDPRKDDSDRDGLSDRAGDPPLPHRPAPRDTDRDGLSDGVEVHRYHRARSNGTPRRPVRRRRGRRGPGPLSRPVAVPAFRRRTPRRAGRDGADPVHRPDHDLDTEHGHRRQDDWLYRGDGAGVVIRNSRISCSGAMPSRVSTAPQPVRRCSSRTPRSTARTPRGTAISETQRLRQAPRYPRLRERPQHQPERHRGGQLHPRPLQQRGGALRWNPVRDRAPPGRDRSCRGSVNVTIRHNTIYGMGSDGSFADLRDHRPQHRRQHECPDREQSPRRRCVRALLLSSASRASTIGYSTIVSAASSARRWASPAPRVRLCGRDPVRRRVPRDRAALAPGVSCVPRSERGATLLCENASDQESD